MQSQKAVSAYCKVSRYCLLALHKLSSHVWGPHQPFPHLPHLSIQLSPVAEKTCHFDRNSCTSLNINKPSYLTRNVLHSEVGYCCSNPQPGETEILYYFIVTWLIVFQLRNKSMYTCTRMKLTNSYKIHKFSVPYKIEEKNFKICRVDIFSIELAIY